MKIESFFDFKRQYNKTLRLSFSHQFIILALLFLSSFQVHAETSCRALYSDRNLKQVAVVDDMLQSNSGYRHNRNFDTYKKTFGQSFLSSTYLINADRRWLDAGAGFALPSLRVAKSYVEKGARAAEGDKAWIVALSVTKPQHGHLQKIEEGIKFSGLFSYLEGKYIEAYKAEELGKFFMITDLYGPLSYATQMDAVLAKYIEILSEGGSLLVAGDFAITRTTIRNKDGDSLLFMEWVETIPGLEIKFVPSERDYVYEIKVLPGAKPVIPKLKLRRLDSAAPPFRDYIEE